MRKGENKGKQKCKMFTQLEFRTKIRVEFTSVNFYTKIRHTVEKLSIF